MTPSIGPPLKQSAAELIVEQWNAKYPVGQPVYARVRNLPKPLRTRTIAPAVHHFGTASVMCLGLPLLVPIRDLVPRYRAWIRIRRKNRVNHWVECVSDSREELLDEVERICRLDPSAQSYEISNQPMGSEDV